MPTQPQKVRASEDADSQHLIDTHDEHALVHWAKALGVTEEALEAAVKAVGPRIDKVKDYLTAGMAAEQSDG